MKFSVRSSLLALACLVISPCWGQAQITTFSQDVNQSINDGLNWLDAQGAFNANSTAGNAAGLVAWCCLKSPVPLTERHSPGLTDAAAGDKTRIQRVIRYIINRSNGSFAAYRDGADMMALSMYL